MEKMIDNNFRIHSLDEWKAYVVIGKKVKILYQLLHYDVVITRDEY